VVKTFIALGRMSDKKFGVEFIHETKWFHSYRIISRCRHHRHPGCGGSGGL
jgi:hypothetical protein